MLSGGVKFCLLESPLSPRELETTRIADSYRRRISRRKTSSLRIGLTKPAPTGTIRRRNARRYKPLKECQRGCFYLNEYLSLALQQYYRYSRFCVRFSSERQWAHGVIRKSCG
ncbi:hypothetical protein M514_06094 [Trichuris suis]|uniref:Uncharacterized protein n=1 Tax=Trichuris suis TaxID=68888 RepID=A0A085NK96_9BILA|nr:hypothetical protein M513_06094 [Trichuris suis]KFD69892.1 hypothetical protein M514_06094 [Trichuris suis]